MAIAQAEGKRRAALIEPPLIGDAQNLHAADALQSLNQPGQKHALIGHGRSVSRKQRIAAIACSWIAATPQFREVVDRGTNSRDQLLHLRSGFPALRRNIRGRPHLVGLQPLEMLALSIKRSHMRPKKLVRRANQEIAIQGLHVDRTVRRVMHGIDEHHRARGMDQFRNLRHRIDRAHHVRRIANSNELGPRRNLAFQVIQVERAVRFPDIDLPDH